MEKAMDKSPKDMTPEEMKEKLDPKVYDIAFNKGTEPPFTGEYYKNKEDGMYHCGVCGAELFSSSNKYESHSGWPSFDQAAQGANIKTAEDSSHGMVRTEVLCGTCGAHLGHLFDDGPKETTGQRFCINSAVLDFQKHGEKKKDKSKEKE